MHTDDLKRGVMYVDLMQAPTLLYGDAWAHTDMLSILFWHYIIINLDHCE